MHDAAIVTALAGALLGLVGFALKIIAVVARGGLK